MKEYTLSELDDSTWWIPGLGNPKRAELLCAWALRSINENQSRSARAFRFGNAYEGYYINNTFSGSGPDDKSDWEFFQIPVIRNKYRRFTNTIVNKLFGNDSTQALLTTNDGDVEQKGKAELIDKLLTESFKDPQGMFNDINAMHRHGGTVSVSSTGEYMIFAFPGNGKVDAELDDTLSVGMVRSGDYGPIRTIVRTAWYEPEELIIKFPKYQKQILANIEQGVPPEFLSLQSVARPDKWVDKRRLVRVIQGWRVKLGPRAPGMELFCLKDRTIIRKRKWTRSRPPIARWQFEIEIGGKWGVPLTQTHYRETAMENHMIFDGYETYLRSPQLVVTAKEGEGGVVDSSNLKSAKGIAWLDLKTGANASDAVSIKENPNYNKNTLEFADFMDRIQHEDTGIPQQHAFNARQPGTTSGVHEHLSASYLTEGFADAERRLIHSRAIETGEIFLWALQDMVTQGDDYIRFVGDDTVKKRVKATDLDLDSDKYVISMGAASEDKDSAKTRADKLEKQFQQGLMDAATYVAEMRTLDVRRAEENAFNREDYIGRQIKKWLYDSPDDWTEQSWYQSPERWDGVEGNSQCLRLVASAYRKAQADNIPIERLQWFEKYMDECVALIQSLKVQEAALLNTSQKVPPPTQGASVAK